MDEQPEIVEFKMPAVAGLVEWDRVRPIRQAIRSLDLGEFLGGALLADLIRRDDAIRSRLGTRIDGVVSKPLELEAAEGTGEKGEEVAAAARIDWPLIAPKSTQRKLMRWGRLLNLGIGELVWNTSGPRWVPRVKVWHPQFASWYQTEERLRLMTLGAPDQPEAESLVMLPQLDRNPHGDGHWILHCPEGYDYCWQEGDVTTLAALYLMRQWCLRDWARKNEVYGLAIRVVSIPASMNDEDKKKLSRRLRNLASETTLEAPMGVDGTAVKLELVESMVHGAETFGELMDRLDSAIAALLLGQNASGPKVSSLGDGQSNQDESVRGDLIAADAEIGPEVWTAQVLHWWTLYNFGDTALTPRAVIRVDPPKALKDTATALSSLATAIPGLQAAGADVRKILEENDVPLLDVAAAPPAPAPTAAQLATLAEGPTSPSSVVDDAIARATAAGQKAMQPYLDGVLADLAKAGDFATLKQRLLDRFKDADPAMLAATLEKSMLLAELYGRVETIRNL